MLSIWNPFLPVNNVSDKSDKGLTRRDYFDRLFDYTINEAFSDFLKPWNNFSGIDYQTSDAGLTVSIDMPGVKESDIKVQLTDNIVNVKAERKTKQSSFLIEKSFSIPKDDYDVESLNAELKDGVLTLSLSAKPKVEKVSKQIEVKINK